MTSHFVTMITCDTAGCEGVVIHRYGSAIASTSRQRADKAGWTRITIGSGWLGDLTEDLCPACSAGRPLVRSRTCRDCGGHLTGSACADCGPAPARQDLAVAGMTRNGALDTGRPAVPVTMSPAVSLELSAVTTAATEPG
ncbi:MAG: hypothetical protein JWN00_5950 [Actinomycetia bacterium]|nr:hypothetical protein [Actinomycetes bacterium]